MTILLIILLPYRYSVLQVSCLEGLGNGQLAMSLYKLIAFVSCTLTQLTT